MLALYSTAKQTPKHTAEIDNRPQQTCNFVS